MKILRKINDLQKEVAITSNLGFVPTMGGLHEGHKSLIKESIKKCKRTLVSIYINPKQFNNSNDYSSYPRNIHKDLNFLKKMKIDYVFIPTTKEIYQHKRNKKIILPKSFRVLCAKFRKDHFEGVIDIMDRFTKLIQPKIIFMGKKDYQQFFIVKKILSKKYKIKIYACKTIRDKNFIALSTRNFLLDKKNLNKASLIAKLCKKLKIIYKNKSNIKKLLLIEKKKIEKKFQIKIDYLELRNENNLSSIVKSNNCRLFIAYYLNKIRLIDNF